MDTPVPRSVTAVILTLAALCCLPEAVLQAADFGLIGSPRWRFVAWSHGAFWSGLLADWRPNYAAQPVVMFVSHSFLHSGFWHLAGNMAVLWMLGRHLGAAGMRAGGVLALWFAGAGAGGLAFAVLGTSAQPVIGASGALFGFAGAWMGGQWRAHPRRIAGGIAGLVALHLLWWAITGGKLAWQTHLGGFLPGWIWGLIAARARR